MVFVPFQRHLYRFEFELWKERDSRVGIESGSLDQAILYTTGG